MFGAPSAFAQGSSPYASSGGPRVAIMRFDGREANVAPTRPINPDLTADCVYSYFQELAQRDKPRYEVLGPDRWQDAARRKARGRTQEVQRIADELKADLVVGGWLEPTKEGRAPYRLTLALYSNWADPLGQFPVDIWSRECDTRMIGRGALPFLSLINQALGLGPVRPAPAKAPPPNPDTPPARPPEQRDTPPTKPPEQRDTPPKDPTPDRPPERPQDPQTGEPARDDRPVTQADDREAAPVTGDLVPAARAARDYLRRPPWREVFSLQAGYLFQWRRFVDEGGFGFNAPGASSGVAGAHGLTLGAELYPLAASRSVPLAAAGLGFRAGVKLPFWADAVEKTAMGTSQPVYSISELQVDVGFLRWHWNVANAPLRPELVLEGLYSYHSFKFTRSDLSNLTPPPSAGYQSVGAGIGTRLHFTRRISAHLGVSVSGLVGLGPMGETGTDTTSTYGAGGGLYVHAEGGFFIPLVSRLGVFATGFYDRYELSFKGEGGNNLIDKDPARPVKSATDQYAGITAGLRYWY